MLKTYSAARADYVVQYRGYTIEVSRETSGWRAGVYPRSPDLPIVHRSNIYCDDQDAAVIEAMDRVDWLFRH
jgi:hypothetical protein